MGQCFVAKVADMFRFLSRLGGKTAQWAGRESRGSGKWKSIRGSVLRLEPLEKRCLLANGMIDLGPSDNVALDQPRVAVEVLTPLVEDPEWENPAHWGSVGPSVFNTLLLDTGANGILAMATAVADLEQPPYVYETQGVFLEAGVAGDHLMDISVPYRFDFAGTDGQRNTIYDARLLSDAENDFSIFGPWGLAGMPCMVDRVTTLDMTGWSTAAAEPELFMRVDFSDDLPASNGHRYSVAVDNRVQFDPQNQTVSGDPPVWGDIPFLTAIPTFGGVGLEGNFLLDTGAQLSVISERLAFDLGLDANGNGTFDDEATRFETVGGVGGTVTAPVVYIDEVRVPTEQGIDLVWTDLQWLVLDITVPGETTTLDGVFGCDLLTSGWVEALFEGKEDGYFQQVHFDFREMDDNGTGAIYFDLTPAIDVVELPGPGVRVLETLGYTEVAENGSEDYFRLVLTSQPTDNVVVQFEARSGAASPNAAQIMVVDDDFGTSQVTFTPADWNVPKIVRVEAINDTIAEGTHTDWIDFTVTSSTDPYYGGLILPGMEVKILDDDLSVLVFSETDGSTIVGESGSYDTYTVSLKSPPSYQVWVELSNSAGQVDAIDPAQSEELNHILFFDSSNWNVPQTVKVVAIDDLTKEGPHFTHVKHEAVEIFANYTFVELGLSLLRVDVIDDDVGSVVILESGGSTEVGEDGQVDSFTIVLNEAPEHPVRIDFSTLDGQVTVVDNAQPLRTYIEFTDANWSVPQTVRVEAVDDFMDEDDDEDRIFHTVTSDDARFDGFSLAPLAVRIVDNDTAGLIITETDGSTVVGGGSPPDTYQIALASQPTANVRIEFDDAGGRLHVVDDAHHGNSFVVFTPADWNVAKTVRVSGGPHGSPHGTTEVVLNHELLSTDAKYRGTHPLTVEVLGDGLVGTSGNDVITVIPGTVEHVVTINGEPDYLDAATATEIRIDGLGGTDTITIYGKGGNESAVLQPDSVDLLAAGYAIHGVNVEAITVVAGNGHHNEATLYGSTASNRLYSYADHSRLTDSARSFSHRVEGFETLTVDVSGGSTDSAYLYDTPDDDELTVEPGLATFTRSAGTATETTTIAIGFQQVYTYATEGEDTAAWTASDATQNRFYGYADYSLFTEARRSFYFYARGFDDVTATSPASLPAYAYLYDSPEVDAFIASTTSATMNRDDSWSDTTATGFARIYAYSTRGGADTAVLNGSSTGGNNYRGYPAYSTLYDSTQSFYHYVRGFHSVTAAGSKNAPSRDRAYLYDSPGADTFDEAFWEEDKYQGGSLTDTGNSYELWIKYFDYVYARSTDSGPGDTIAVENERLLAYRLLRMGTW